MQRGDALDGIAGAYQVLGFKEKPDKPTADRYVESGRYYWNSGMFVWRADTVMNVLKELLPASHDALSRIAAAWGSPQQQETVDALYPTLQKISVDYAIMEPAGAKNQVAVVEMPVKWLDVGSWPQLSETLEIDEFNNAADARRDGDARQHGQHHRRAATRTTSIDADRRERHGRRRDDARRDDDLPEVGVAAREGTRREGEGGARRNAHLGSASSVA